MAPRGRTRVRFAASAAAALTLACSLFAPGPAEAVVAEKIVAVVGDDAILLSELRTRGRPFVRLMHKQVPAGPQRAAAESKIYAEILEKMIEEVLEQQAADRVKVVVTPEEIDRAFENLAAQSNMTVDQLFAATEQKGGLGETEYRAEIRRQILEGKMISQRIRGRVRITEEDLRNAYTRAVREERERREYRPAWIALRILPGSSPDAVAEREKLAKSLADRLENGEKFADLAKQYSDDAKTRDKGGDMGIHAPTKTQAAQTGKRPALAKELEDRVLALEPGEHTEPFRVADAIVILTVLNRQPSRFTTFEAARAELTQRVQNEILAREKQAWLEELGRRTHIERRL